jgi:hypothetical protein
MSGSPQRDTILSRVHTWHPTSPFTAQGVSVLDGDGIEVLHNHRLARIHLKGIDCQAMRATRGLLTQSLPRTMQPLSR